jgi:phosphoribosylanthranilate isomerase
MKRIIKFRGKDCLTGEWVYGYYTTAKTRDPETGEKTIKHIIHADDGLHEVEEDTVGQYTGMKDWGGLGIDTPISAPAYASKVHLGFAGGINPDNVIDKMDEITSLPVGRFWIDMESGVRTDDRFDLDKVEDVCKKVYDEFLTVKS